MWGALAPVSESVIHMTSIRIELFGGIAVDVNGIVTTHFRTQKTAGLLAYLALKPERAHLREELIDIFWNDQPIESGRGSLSASLSSLRKILEPNEFDLGTCIISTRQTVSLSADSFRCDISEFEKRVLECRLESNPLSIKQTISSALKLWCGEPLVGRYEEWALREQRRLLQLKREAILKLISAQQAVGDTAQALEATNSLFELDLFDEEAVRIKMGLLSGMGRHATALTLYTSFADLLKKELNAQPTPSLVELFHSIREVPVSKTLLAIETPPNQSSAQVVSYEATPSNLPMSITSFVGRELELEKLQTLVPNSRLVTLTGPGGIGKTRLALEIGSRLKAQFQERVWFVSLAEVYSQEQLSQSISRSFKLSYVREEDEWNALVETLKGSRSLLILDNFEQLLIDPEEANRACSTVKSLLSALPELVCIVTSRQVLLLDGEQEFLVNPLESPSGEENVEQLQNLPCVQLLLERASLIRPDFCLNNDNLATVRQISTLLEGYPLAIELAVGWIRSLDLEGIEARLIDRFELLVSRRRDVSDRHRTLFTAIEKSYQYLPEGLQIFFRTLSVFKGGCDLKSCRQICKVERPESFLIELQERSLVIAERVAPSIRFRMLETIREFAWIQLSEEDRKVLKERHARYFQELLADVYQQVNGSNSPKYSSEVINGAISELDNLRGAIQWALESELDDVAVSLAIHLDWLFMVRGYFKERRDLALLVYERFKEREISGSDRQTLFHNAAFYFSDDLRLKLARENLASRRLEGDPLELGEALVTLAGLATNPFEIESLFTEAIATLKKQNDTYRTHLALANFAGFHTSQKAHDKSLPILTECLAYVHEKKDFWGEAKILLAIGHNLRNSGLLVQSREILEESRRLYLQLEDPWHLQDVECNLLETYFQMGLNDDTSQLIESVRNRNKKLKLQQFTDLADRIEKEMEAKRFGAVEVKAHAL